MVKTPRAAEMRTPRVRAVPVVVAQPEESEEPVVAPVVETGPQPTPPYYEPGHSPADIAAAAEAAVAPPPDEAEPE